MVERLKDKNLMVFQLYCKTNTAGRLIKKLTNERERQIPCDVTCMWNLKITNEVIYKTDSQMSKIYGYQRKKVRGGGIN